MRTNISVLSRLQVFEMLYRSGYQSRMLERALDKLIALEAGHIQSELAELNDRLKAFETRYQMTSEVFYQRYEHGELGDSADFTEWASFYDMRQLARQHLEWLEGTSR
jgi:hypothetical protein